MSSRYLFLIVSLSLARFSFATSLTVIEEHRGVKIVAGLIEYIAIGEGYRPKPFLDNKRNKIVATGQILELSDHHNNRVLKDQIPQFNQTTRDEIKTWGFSDEQAVYEGTVSITTSMSISLMHTKIKKSIEALLKLIPDLPNMSYARQVVLIDMMYNLGTNKFGEFRRMINAVNSDDWEAAIFEMKNSLWFNQVGLRSERNLNTVVGNRLIIKYQPDELLKNILKSDKALKSLALESPENIVAEEFRYAQDFAVASMKRKSTNGLMVDKTVEEKGDQRWSKHEKLAIEKVREALLEVIKLEHRDYRLSEQVEPVYTLLDRNWHGGHLSDFNSQNAYSQDSVMLHKVNQLLQIAVAKWAHAKEEISEVIPDVAEEDHESGALNELERSAVSEVYEPGEGGAPARNEPIIAEDEVPIESEKEGMTEASLSAKLDQDILPMKSHYFAVIHTKDDDIFISQVYGVLFEKYTVKLAKYYAEYDFNIISHHRYKVEEIQIFTESEKEDCEDLRREKMQDFQALPVTL